MKNIFICFICFAFLLGCSSGPEKHYLLLCLNDIPVSKNNLNNKEVKDRKWYMGSLSIYIDKMSRNAALVSDNGDENDLFQSPIFIFIESEIKTILDHFKNNTQPKPMYISQGKEQWLILEENTIEDKKFLRIRAGEDKEEEVITVIPYNNFLYLLEAVIKELDKISPIPLEVNENKVN